MVTHKINTNIFFDLPNFGLSYKYGLSYNQLVDLE